MKFIKAGAKVNEKLTLPKDLQWKIFGTLLDDLWRKSPTSSMSHEATVASDELYARLKGIVRRRSIDDLIGIIPEFTPRCIVERVGTERRNAFMFFVQYQAGAFLKKYPFRAKEAKNKAIVKFLSLERQCALFNSENHRAIRKLNDWHERFLNVLEEMRSDIKKVIGECPPDDVFVKSKHGPGASVETDSSTGEVTEFFKFRNLPYYVTSQALPLAKEVVSSDERWIGALDEWYRKRCDNLYGPIDLEDFWSRVFRTHDFSRITTVPKSFEIDRTIAIEPRLNVYLQLGVDRFLRRQINRHWRFDLDDQTWNQDCAFIGSVTGGLSTLDLAGASDTISLRCCELLLPPAWYSLLLDLRCPAGVMPGGDTLTFEKISSMGNGFTFALETLIFGAVVRAAVRRTQSIGPSCVYGDDIIVPGTAYALLVEYLELFGFRVNEDKSFNSGPFRESCGKDFFLGIPVRPLFLTSSIRGISDLFYLHNSIFELERRLPWTWGVDLSATQALIRKYLPPIYREQFYGPPSESMDTYLFSWRKPREEKWGKGSGLAKCVYKLVPVAVDFERLGKRYDDFHFRKLMASLGEKAPIRPWEIGKRTLPAKGNVFNITKRSRVTLKCTRSRLPQWGGR